MSHVLGATNHRSVVVLLSVALGLQALGGLLLPRMYRDSLWVVTSLRSSDIANLVLVIPLLLGFSALTRRGYVRARLAYAGVIFFVWENNLYYLTGCTFNQLFLVYVAISVLSLIELIAVLSRMDQANVRLLEKTPRKTIALILVSMAAILCVLWVGQSIDSLISGKPPQMLVDSGGSANLVAAFDLSILVPLNLLGAVLLWRGHIWGSIISAGILVQGNLAVAGLLVTSPVQAAAGISGAWTMLPVWVLMGSAIVFATILVFRNVVQQRTA